MDAALLVLPVFSATGLILVLIGYLLRSRLTAKLQRITFTTTGTVSGYSRLSFDPIPGIFPVGMPLPVHYNPGKPRENYAVRHPGSAMAPILTWAGLGLVLAAALTGVLTWLLA